MAVNFLNNLDLNGNQLLNARLQVLASDPGSAVAGDIIYNSSSNVFKFYNGSAWVDPSAGSYTSWTLSGGSGSATILNNNTVSITGSGAISTAVTTPTGGIHINTISLAAATATVRGGVELFSNTVQSTASNLVSSTAQRTYGIQLNSDGQAVVNVPWTDNSKATVWNANIFGAGTGPFTIGNNGDLTLKPNSPISITMGGSNDDVNYSISLDDSGVTAASYTNANITVDAKGRITAASNGTDNNTTYTLPTSVPAGNAAAATLTGSDGSTDAVNFTGTTNQTKITAATQGQIVIGLADNVTTVGDLTVGGGDITLSGTGRIQGIDTVSAGTDAANKTYVDESVVGNLVFQGGYNAATNTPDLDSSPSSSIKKGWAYVVTNAGSFFTETVEVGDFLFAKDDAPTTLADWVTVQNNVGLATATTVGIGNVVASSAASADGMTVSYSNGTATIAWSIKSLSVISNAIADADRMAILDQSTNDQKAVELSTLKTYFQSGLSQGFAGTSSSGTTHTFNHNLNTYDVIVQVYDASNYETVYADVDRTSVNQVVVTTAASANIRCLINNVG